MYALVRSGPYGRFLEDGIQEIISNVFERSSATNDNEAE